MTPSIDPAADWTLRVALGLLLVSAARHKLRDLGAFRGALAAYALLPARSIGFVSIALPGSELVLGLLMGLPGLAPLAPAGAAVLLAIYSSAVGVNLLRGRSHVECGCAGPDARRTLSGALVGRNIALMAACGLCLLPDTGRALVWVDAISIGGGVTALALLYAGIDTALENASAFRRWSAPQWLIH